MNVICGATSGRDTQVNEFQVSASAEPLQHILKTVTALQTCFYQVTGLRNWS